LRRIPGPVDQEVDTLPITCDYMLEAEARLRELERREILRPAAE
jgi:hypothetical protein